MYIRPPHFIRARAGVFTSRWPETWPDVLFVPKLSRCEYQQSMSHSYSTPEDALNRHSWRVWNGQTHTAIAVAELDKSRNVFTDETYECENIWFMCVFPSYLQEIHIISPNNNFFSWAQKKIFWRDAQLVTEQLMITIDFNSIIFPYYGMSTDYRQTWLNLHLNPLRFL